MLEIFKKIILNPHTQKNIFQVNLNDVVITSFTLTNTNRDPLLYANLTLIRTEHSQIVPCTHISNWCTSYVHLYKEAAPSPYLLKTFYRSTMILKLIKINCRWESTLINWM